LRMRMWSIMSLLMGLLVGFLLSGRVATSQEESFPSPAPEGRGRFQVAGHSTYPPLLLDSETGTSWILLSESDGEERRWFWEPIEIGALESNPSPGTGREVVRLQAPPRSPPHRVTASQTRRFNW
jgi:hypothetical protein